MSGNNKLLSEHLVGQTITSIEGLQPGSEEVRFYLKDSKKVIIFERWQYCCEEVTLEDFTGELEWLLDSPILKAEESTNSEDDRKSESDDSFTRTFYRFSTIKGTVTVRWYGSSNGYYSEEVSISIGERA